MTRRRVSLNPPVVMWAAILGSVLLLATLLVLGWQEDAWAAAAAVLLLSCVFVCVWAAAQGRRSEREVQQAVARLAESREADARGRRSGGR